MPRGVGWLTQRWVTDAGHVLNEGLTSRAHLSMRPPFAPWSWSPPGRDCPVQPAARIGGRKIHGLTKFCKEGRVALVLELASRCWAYGSIRCSSSRFCAAGPRSRPTSPQSNTTKP
eukprot:scaffold105890_cov24-Phaeocystis_antarctica.AAC.1